MVQLTDGESVSALGLTRKPQNGKFTFILKKWTPPSIMTKRTLLSDINSIYNPIGLISPALIRGNIFIQQLKSMKLSWDDILPVDLQSK